MIAHDRILFPTAALGLVAIGILIGLALRCAPADRGTSAALPPQGRPAAQPVPGAPVRELSIYQLHEQITNPPGLSGAAHGGRLVEGLEIIGGDEIRGEYVAGQRLFVEPRFHVPSLGGSKNPALTAEMRAEWVMKLGAANVREVPAKSTGDK